MYQISALWTSQGGGRCGLEAQDFNTSTVHVLSPTCGQGQKADGLQLDEWQSVVVVEWLQNKYVCGELTTPLFRLHVW